ncbi:MAG: TIGR02281 family clan AA aspartic protease [Aestuariibacter sp.]
MANEQNNSSILGKGMFIAAWLIALGLLSVVFDEQLMQQFNPNQQPESRTVSNRTEVILKRNRQGHYVTSGVINGKNVIFLVDTGATDVSVPAHLAEDLNLPQGRPLRSRTANGTVTVYDTNIEYLAIAELMLQDVDGNINPGMQGNEILLGMSVLKQLEFTQRGDTLILRTL